MKVIWAVLVATCCFAGAMPVFANEKSDASPGTGEITGLLSSAYLDVERKNLRTANREFKSVIDMEAFGRLSSTEQHKALYVAGWVALRLDNPKQAGELFKRSSSMSEAGYNDWGGRLYAASRTKDVADASASLTALAQRWPEKLAVTDETVIFWTAREIRKKSGTEAYFNLLNALSDAQWKDEHVRESDELWWALISYLMEQGKIERAAVVASRLALPSSIVRIRIDKNFDAIFSSAPEKFDVGKTIGRYIDHLKLQADQSPRSLRIRAELVDALNTARRYAETVKVADDIIQKIQSAERGHEPYDDGKEFIWILDAKAQALGALGRVDEAVKEYERAGEQRERGMPNVSQLINLGDFYCEHGRPQEALKAIARAGYPSDYGRMQVETVRHAAALQMNDLKEASRALNYMRSRQKDALHTFQTALIRANQLDEAAQLLITRLADPALRRIALMRIQRFAETAVPVGEQEFIRLKNEFLNRADVKAAIEQVGRVESFDIEPPTTC